MRRWIAGMALLIAAGAPAASEARLLGDAAIAYSAERTVTLDGHSYTGMVFHIPGHDRHEQSIAGISEVILLDAAQKEGFLLVPLLSVYVPFAFPELMAELDAPDFHRHPVGHETVNGVRTTKYRIDHTAADGSHARGFAWVSAEGVLMRLDGTVARPGYRPASIRMELANLALGPQDPALFRLPAGLVRLPPDTLQRFFGGQTG